MTTISPESRTTGKPSATVTSTLDPAERRRLESAFSVPRGRVLAGIPLALVVLLWSMGGAEFDFAELSDGAVNMGEFLSRLFPPDFSKFGTIVELLVETLQMAIVGTVLGGILSLLVAFAAASNIAPKWLYYTARWTMNIIRSVPDLVFALMFVSAVGLGPFAGILAMTLGSIGSIGKIYAEAMEAVDRGPVVAMEAVGACQRQVIIYGTLPQAAPNLVSYTLLLFEGNVRGATILGLVGAGGIGLELTTAMKMYDYGHLSAIIVCIIVLVTVIDQASALIRRRIT
ncbi:MULTISPECIES: phosphonate ABC transporter, permease protein PhnE [Rhodococcus]|uniref:phosphonate ABC transporter, permease protein PhnE n=1 Tax=Rhodococcus TaxID=1827 RepID=UPI00193AFBC3|nr:MULTISPECIES: phosphonate ABC transporter, permease protein PhnE [Rhodococcus]QRI79242.1 phosphonate ABC transporter, permease protein PhnE [Rhodococcus aetherivorans]QSE62427.1 phosphonate ABC transporter, permease protein PhnE [Rhodococcus sp. PSBB066]